MAIYIPYGQAPQTGGICIDNIFFPPSVTWTFTDYGGGYAPTYNGNTNTSENDPDAPKICFDIVRDEEFCNWISYDCNVYYAFRIPDAYNDDLFNMRFTAPSDGTLRYAQIALSETHCANNSGSGIFIFVAESDGTFPSTQLDYVTIPGNEIVYYPSYNTVEFDPPIPLSAGQDFHIGYSVWNKNVDTFAVLADDASCGTLRSSESWDGTWGLILDDWGYDVNFLIDAYFCSDIPETRIHVDQVEGLDENNHALANSPVKFNVKFLNESPYNASSVSNGYRVWTTNNGYTGNFTPPSADTIPGILSSMFDLGIFFSYYTDGLDEDTVGIGATTIIMPGMTPPFDDNVYWIETTPTSVGDTLCIDSVDLYGPSGNWGWWLSSIGFDTPYWGGPYCFYVDANCGDANGSGSVNILDATYLIGYLYKDDDPPLSHECVGDATGGGAVNILDVTNLINYLYRDGPAPVKNCCQPVW